MRAKTTKTTSLLLDIQSIARLRAWARRHRMTAGQALSFWAERFNQPGESKARRGLSFGREVQPTLRVAHA